MIRLHLVINDYDMTENLGVCIGKGTIEDLLTLPEFKRLRQNDWFEHDGIEYDLSAPKFRNKTATLNLFSRGEQWNIADAIIDGMDYASLSIPQIGLSFDKCRFNRGVKSSVLGGLHEYSIETFIDDIPFYGYNPSSTVPAQRGTEPMSFDSVNLSHYGVKLLKGWASELSRLPQLKQPMTRDIYTENSVICDAGAHFKKFYLGDMPFDMLIRGTDAANAIEKYKRFMYAITRPGYRTCTHSSEDSIFSHCIYKSAKVTEFIPDTAWLRFTLTLTGIE